MDKVVGLAVGLLLALGVPAALAQEEHGAHGDKPATGMAHGHKGMESGKSAMGHGASMEEMHGRMQALHEHSKMMKGITDERQLAEEMKKHMRMLDDMMQQMMMHQM